MIASRVREIMSGPASSALVLIMLAGCLFLWIGVPLGWLWIGSQVQGSASLGTAMLVTMLGITATSTPTTSDANEPFAAQALTGSRP